MYLRICESFKMQKIRSDPLIANPHIANNIGSVTRDLYAVNCSYFEKM